MNRTILLMKNSFMRIGIKIALDKFISNPDIVEVNSWRDVRENLGQAVKILIADMELTTRDDIQQFNKFRREYPGLKVLFFGEENDQQMSVELLKKGADYICLKSVSISEFESVCKRVLLGQKYIPESISDFLLTDLRRRSVIKSLSPRETQVSFLLLRGMRTAEISKVLSLAPSTVSTIKFNLYKKMEVDNVIDLLAKVS
ncbi:LuxR C-terminal-related transcriptional regulator [Dyadobacter diqingensis]|uniref:LuxR C-terminal-related transcriptional regulator n=1 Tax=Dyadobacter diqingensis TaxID=2938121 RepID=UPI0020C1902E|nr:response regulator transcription factor [Dyadobacter diqingensis]